MDSRGAFFREIHKNTWLKRLHTESKRFPAGGKRSEKNWVVFCVHNDTEALLEGYTEPRSAASHNPEWTISLQSTQHISHSLVPSEQEYEFVITLNDEVVRFHTFSWEVMQEWVSTLRSKLRELKILSPRENLYTKLPEPRLPLLPTRDPTSPLPATPEVPPVNVPGVERVLPSTNNSTSEHVPLATLLPESNQEHHTENVNAASSASASVVQQANETTSVHVNDLSSIRLLSNSPRNNTQLDVGSPHRKFERKPTLRTENSVKVDVSLTDIQSTRNVPSANSYQRSDDVIRIVSDSNFLPSGELDNTPHKENGNAKSNEIPVSSVHENSANDVVTNITIIQVSNTFHSNQSRADSNSQEFTSNIEVLPTGEGINLEPISSTQLLRCTNDVSSRMNDFKDVTTVCIPGIPSTSTYGFVYPKETALKKIDQNEDLASNNVDSVTNISVGNGSLEEISDSKTETFEKSIFLADNMSRNISSLDLSLSKASISENARRQAVSRIRTISEVASPASSLLEGTSMSPNFEGRSKNNIRRSKSGQTSTQEKSLLVRGPNKAFMFPKEPKPFPGLLRGARNEDNKRRLALRKSASQTNAREESTSSHANKTLTFREQQVLFLKKEIMHPGGIRLQLRRKDCINSIAWVDAFDCVWVAGWKQKEHPMLYNALHIGDQLISIGQNVITNADEANKIIRNSNTLFLEILVKRVPYGRVYAIRREKEGQCLGLIRDGNTATIVDVVPNSIADRHGLPPRVKSCDGLHLTFWVLTEICGRPLNMFAKDNEVQDRLNCVGRDISLLVQPSDLITRLKKQLKALRSYKDYIVQ